MPSDSTTEADAAVEGLDPAEPAVAEGQAVAAIDMGSNSFHMVIGRVEAGVPVVIDRLKEPVRLAAGLDGDKKLTDDAVERALACLARFRERLEGLGKTQVRAVGTNTMRRARNSRAFARKASAALGHEVETISGREEARLIYLGVAHDRAVGGRRLVIDIGGGSTECVIGDGNVPIAVDSLYMGCVSYSMRYFGDGALTKGAFKRATLDAARKLEPIARPYRKLGWLECFGSSGTIGAISEISKAEGWSDGTITAKVVRRLRKRMIEAGSVGGLELKGMPEERRQVLAGGVAILAAVIEELGIETMERSHGALREGVLSDLLGRMRDEDVRDAAVEGACKRFGVDRGHAERVETTALALFDHVAEPLGLDAVKDRKRLGWAARLHEVGLALTYSSHHKHGAYLIANCELAGFSHGEQRLIAALVAGHRRKLRMENFEVLPEAYRKRALHLTALLRIAVVLCRSRNPEGPPSTRLAYRRGHLILVMPPDWLAEHPLANRDVEIEAERLAKVGITLDAL